MFGTTLQMFALLQSVVRVAAAGFLIIVFASMPAGSATPSNVDWPSYNNDLRSTRYSPLGEITASNASNLHRVCRRRLQGNGPFESSTLAIGGVIYVVLVDDTYAIDGKTCAIRWRHHYVPGIVSPLAVARGAAIAGTRLIRGTSDAHLVALDIRSGKVLWNVSAGNAAIGEYYSASPIVWKGTVFLGTGVGDFGIRGRMLAFDAATGRKMWTFETIASGSDPNAGSWKDAAAAKHGGGGTWTSYTLDPDSGELFVPVGNPSPVLSGAAHRGSNLYTNSIVVLDARTGKLKWFYQVEPHDVHDWDLSAPPVLYTARNGKSMVVAGSKSGYIFGIDRATRTLVFKTSGGIRMENTALAPTPSGVHFCPGTSGGTEWDGVAYDALTHQLLSPMDDWCGTMTSGPHAYKPGAFFLGGSSVLDKASTARGVLSALDAETGHVTWMYRSRSPMIAGVTPTAGGVIFTGDMQGHFLVFASRGGKLLYKDRTAGSLASGVITYAIDGKQYVEMNSGHTLRFVFAQASGDPYISVYAL